MQRASIGKLSRYQTLARPELHSASGARCSSHDADRNGPLDMSTVAVTSMPTAISPRRAPIRHAWL